MIGQKKTQFNISHSLCSARHRYIIRLLCPDQCPTGTVEMGNVCDQRIEGQVTESWSNEWESFSQTSSIYWYLYQKATPFHIYIYMVLFFDIYIYL